MASLETFELVVFVRYGIARTTSRVQTPPRECIYLILEIHLPVTDGDSYNSLTRADKRYKNFTKYLRELYNSFNESGTFKWQDIVY